MSKKKNRNNPPVSVAAHLQELQKKHQTLSAAVEELQKRPGVDPLEVRGLKKQKLRLKEQMEQLMKGSTADRQTETSPVTQHASLTGIESPIVDAQPAVALPSDLTINPAADQARAA